MEKQEKTMRPIPKNVRQIGEHGDDIKLYVEDYVNTFIRKCARSGKTVVGALLGDYYCDTGKEYLFVEGAVQADGYRIIDGKVVMTDDAWSGLYGKISEYFAGRTICGWFLCSSESEECNVSLLRGFMYDNLGAEKRVLVVHNTEAEEEIFSVYDLNVIREQQGYYLFYERNEPMQSYMVTTAFAIRTDPVAVDAVATNVRTRMVEKKEIPEQRTGYSFVAAAALVLGVIALASGIVMMNHYEQLREMKAMLTGLTGSWLESQTGREDETRESEPKFGGLIIEDVRGDILPSREENNEETEPATEKAPEKTAENREEESSSEDTAAVPNESEEEAAKESEPETEPETHSTESPADETAAGSDKEMNGVPEYRTYLVEKGDTLVTICWRLYGYRDDELIDRICEINRLEDKDHIYAGQELLIP